MLLRRTIFMATIALSSASALATTVQVTVNVTPTAAEIGQHIGNGLRSYSTDPSFPVRPSFSMVIQFDLDNLTMTPTALANGGVVLVNETAFQNGSTSTTPYTQGLTASLPPYELASWPDSTQVTLRRNMTSSGDPDVARPVLEGFAATTNVGWRTEAQGEISWITYGRTLTIRAEANELAGTFAPKDEAQALAWLNAQIGSTIARGYNEGYLKSRTNAYKSDDIREWTDWRVRGDVQILSVTVVPEPATNVLMGMGMLALVLGARKQRQLMK